MKSGARILALIGLRGTGKSSIGRSLASLRGAPFLDLDSELARAENEASAGSLLAKVGATEFRRLELKALRACLGAPVPPAGLILATGGGCVEPAAGRELLRQKADCVWLRAPVEELVRRIEADGSPRPRLHPEVSLRREMEGLAASRDEHYRGLSRLIFETGIGSAASLAEKLSEELDRNGLGP